MRILVLVVVLTLTFGATLAGARTDKVNFSGTWILNADKSELGDTAGGRGRVANKIIATQEKNKLVVESFRKNREGEETSNVATYTLDGKKCENTVNERTSVSTGEWSEDGKSLIIKTEMAISREGQEFKVQSEATWSLEKGELVIETSRTSPRGNTTNKAVYTLEKNKS